MRCTALALASAAAATAACLTVMYALREPAEREPVAAQASLAPTPSEPGASAPGPKRIGEPGAPGTARGEADFLSEVARAEEAREQALRSAILSIGDDEALSLDARLERYREALREARGETPGDPGFEPSSMWAEVFLRMDGVQRELAAMSPSARSRELAHIRRELGYAEEAIARMEAIDERREARWQSGLAYMQERARLASSFEGEALEAELRALRDEYFAHEAGTIEAEERDGFFRFERPRIYGRN